MAGLDRLLRRSEARRLAGDISKSTEFRLIKNPKSGWPKPRQISPGLTGYSEAEMRRYLEGGDRRGETESEA